MLADFAPLPNVSRIGRHSLHCDLVGVTAACVGYDPTRPFGNPAQDVVGSHITDIANACTVYDDYIPNRARQIDWHDPRLLFLAKLDRYCRRVWQVGLIGRQIAYCHGKAAHPMREFLVIGPIRTDIRAYTATVEKSNRVERIADIGNPQLCMPAAKLQSRLLDIHFHLSNLPAERPVQLLGSAAKPGHMNSLAATDTFPKYHLKHGAKTAATVCNVASELRQQIWYSNNTSQTI